MNLNRISLGCRMCLVGLLFLVSWAPSVYSRQDKRTETPVSISFVSVGEKKEEGRFEVKGLTPVQLKALSDESVRNQSLKVGTRASQNLLGKTGISESILWFQPRFPLATELDHLVTFIPPFEEGKKTKPIEMRFRLPAPNTPPPRITAVYPSTDTVPENLLKFYVHFSNPMRHGEIYSRMRILNESGKAVGLPFLELDEELWDATMTRVTLLIDPGRIKRGVQGRMEEGPVLEAGKSFVLELDGGLIDAAGKPLGKTMRKAFKVVDPVHARVDSTDWSLIVPKRPQDPLEIRFPRPLDQALLMRELSVHDAQGVRLKGTTETGEKETIWRFRPEAAWVPGNYQVRIGLTLEDLAGNRPDRIFDAPPKEGKENIEPILKLDFQVK